jgi:hypothetical protein
MFGAWQCFSLELLPVAKTCVATLANMQVNPFTNLPHDLRLLQGAL